jgi:hypothetical protein
MSWVKENVTTVALLWIGAGFIVGACVGCAIARMASDD